MIIQMYARLFYPGDLIIKTGSPVEEIAFILSGQVGLVSEDN
jgi:signal-transduction protein with cAMP-binding, CBS, and nucleotidyltransferase domain